MELTQKQLGLLIEAFENWLDYSEEWDEACNLLNPEYRELHELLKSNVLHYVKK